jgi:hypothetical protein
MFQSLSDHYQGICKFLVKVTELKEINTLRTGIFFLYIYNRSLIRSEVTFL